MILAFVFALVGFGAEGNLSGIPRFIRGSPQTEVFFKDLKDSFIIPHNDSHNRILKAFIDAQKTGKPVNFRADPKVRVILGLSEVTAPAAVDAPSAPAVTAPPNGGGKPNN